MCGTLGGMGSKQPALGNGSLQWNASRWFGSLAGATLWLLAGGLAFLGISAPVAVTWLICFLAVNAVGLALWLRRDALRPYWAFQILLASATISAVVAIATLDVCNPRGGPVAAGWPAYLATGVFPALMGLLAIRERWSRKASGVAAGSKSG